MVAAAVVGACVVAVTTVAAVVVAVAAVVVLPATPPRPMPAVGLLDGPATAGVPGKGRGAAWVGGADDAEDGPGLPSDELRMDPPDPDPEPEPEVEPLVAVPRTGDAGDAAAMELPAALPSFTAVVADVVAVLVVASVVVVDPATEAGPRDDAVAKEKETAAATSAGLVAGPSAESPAGRGGAEVPKRFDRKDGAMVAARM